MIICILCTSGRGTGGLLYNHKMNWFSEEPEPPEECPQCGSSLGLFTLAHDEPAAVAVAAETLLAQREEIKRLDATLTTSRANLQHVEHALGERLRPGQTLEQAIAELSGDLDRAHGDVERLRAENERLKAERAALLTPVEGTDLERVLRLDRDGTPAERWKVDHTSRWEPVGAYVRYIAVNEYREVTRQYGIDDFPARDAELEAALAPIKTDEALITLYRTAAPALAREVVRLRAAQRDTFKDGQIAAIERTTPIVNDIAAQRDSAGRRAQALAARLAALEPVLTAAAQIMGVQAVAPTTPEEGGDYAAKLWGRVNANMAARLAALEPVLNDLAMILGVEVVAPATPEEGQDFATKLWQHAKAAEETRLTLLAELGDIKGAPSRDWSWTHDAWNRDGAHVARRPARWNAATRRWTPADWLLQLRSGEQSIHATARAAMIHANAALSAEAGNKPERSS